MANWNKLIYSGSNAEFSTVTSSLGIQLDTLTENRIILVGASGSLIDNAGLAFDGAELFISASDISVTTTKLSLTGSDGDFVIDAGNNNIFISSSDFGVVASGEAFITAPDGIYLTSLESGVNILGDLDVSGSVVAHSFTGSFSGSFVGDIPSTLVFSGSDGTGGSVDFQTESLLFTTSSSAGSQGIEITTSASSVVFSLTDNITVDGLLTASTGSILGDLTVEGNLVVQGDVTEIQTTNLLVEDRFILLNSGSISSMNPKGGIIIDEGGGSGSALFYTSLGSVDRWSLAQSVEHDASTATPTAYIAAVVDMAIAEHSASVALYEQVGNIKIEDGEVYIWA
jgi:hypothetical protein